MASISNIDIEDATQHLRDILKLDRPANCAEPTSESQKKSSFNGELNGLLGADLLGAGDRVALAESAAQNADMNAQEPQIICLSGDDGSTCIAVSSGEVEIVASHQSSISSKAHGSNKVKIQPVAKYEWEQKYYYGNLIAVSSSYLAYAIRGANSYAMVRVLCLGTAERTLLKGFTGAITDLAFAHLDSNHLACVDQVGSLFIWQLTCLNGKIQDEIVLHIRRPADTPLNSNRRLVWCPFIPEENVENPDDSCQTLALLHEDRAEVWDLDILRANRSWPLDATEVKDGFITIKGHDGRISEGALAPDGTVLATASHDGYVKFWQIYIEGQDQPRCLHEWKPHGGRPLSCLLFCDNHKKQDPDVPFWRFLITGADQNRELKMWCTVSWTCLQTIRFSPDPFDSSVLPSLKAGLDLSSEYLILSDVQRKVLYVMELLQDQEKGRAGFTAVSEFLLTNPVLSFGIRDVSRARLRHTEVLPPEEESESMTTEGSHAGAVESEDGVLIKLYCVHTKSLQDVQIWFQPRLSTSSSLSVSQSDSQEDLSYHDNPTKAGMEGLGLDKESGRGSQNELHRIPDLPAPVDFLSHADNGQPELMTPDAFMAPTGSVPASPRSSANSLPAVTLLSTRGAEDLNHSPKVSLESSGVILNGSSSPSSSLLLIPSLADQLPPNAIQVIDPLLVPVTSPARERSPDVISSASSAVPQDIPEIASETLPRDHADTSLRDPRQSPELAGAVGGAAADGERLRTTPSLLETALTQESAPNCTDGSMSQSWPAAPDITRETCNSLADCSCEVVNELLENSRYLRASFNPPQNHSQDASAEQSDHDEKDLVNTGSSSTNGGPRTGHRLPVKEWKVSPRGSPKLKKKPKKDEGEFSQSRQTDQQLADRLSSVQMTLGLQEELLLLLRGQQRELLELRQGQLELLQRLTSHADVVQGSIMALVERAVVSQQEQNQRRLERLVAEERDRNRQLQDQQLAQSLNSLSTRLDKVLREEMKKAVPLAITKSLEPVTGQLSSTISTKLAAVEGALKENVTKVVKSKSTTDAIGRAVAEAMQGPIQTVYKEAFQSVVLPVFEKGCQSMFQQINDSFKQGTNEYIQQLENHLKNKRQHEQDARDPLIGQLQQVIDAFQNSTDQLASTVTASVRSEVQHQLQVVVGNLQDSILTQVQRIVKGEVGVVMREQQAMVTSSIVQAMRSAASTPVPTTHLDYHSQQAAVLQLLQQGQLNQAFQQALSAADLNLVLYACETIDSHQVFSQHPCPLIQPVLLSLIQQLSTNLATRSELKISYLEDAVMNLDLSDPVTKDHISSVLSQVKQKLFQFLQQDPQNPLSKRARCLMMMLQGLVNH